MRNAFSYLARTRVFDRIVALDEFDMAIANRIEELVHEGNYRKMHAAGTAAQEQGSAGARGPILEDF